MKKDIVKIMWKFITDSDFRFLVMGKYGLLNYMDDEKYLKRMYQINMGKKLDLANPKLFNEKLQWLKLYDRNPLYTTMVDKYAVKKYVGEIIGDEYIIPTIGVWNSAEDIDLLYQISLFLSAHMTAMGWLYARIKVIWILKQPEKN